MTKNKNFFFLAFPLVLGGSLFLSACDQQKDASQHQAQPPSPHSVTDQLQTPPVKDFPVTANDAQDIALLDEFDERFTAMSDDMENELAKMQQDGSLTPEFEHHRKLDHIQSALGMLKALDLKTAQGRYIQGLLYQYWDHQGKLLNDQSSSTTTQTQTQNKATLTVQNLSEYLHAQEQLKHWKDQQKAS